MSLSSALSAAVNGLDIASRRASIVASNVSNADRPGYARRDLAVEPISIHAPGLKATVQRQRDAGSLAVLRDATAGAAGAGIGSAFWSDIVSAIGEPDAPNSLSGRINAFEISLTDAVAQPGSPNRLAVLAEAANDVVGKINEISGEIQQSRQNAEDQIVNEVASLNADLKAVADLNGAISSAVAGGAEYAALEDRRDALLSKISESLEIKVLQRDFGAVALVSKGGSILLDGKPAEITFTPVVEVTPDRTLGAGLNGLLVNGRDVPIQSGTGSVGGGRLAAFFETRDNDAVLAQAELDALADDLVRRFSDPATDPTLLPGDTGLFQDPLGGTPGAASRLELNPLINPKDPATHFRLRDGLNATAPDFAAPVGNLSRMIDALARRQIPADPVLGSGANSFQGLAAARLSNASSAASRAEGQRFDAESILATAREHDSESGVDVDEEMRRLIEIEQQYAAAARVVQAVDEMMERLTRF
ncbi:flagellar hook-associated protein FlgK [Jannaschia aquimarina]|uniref:Flagellar hook-associated protein 1 n=1 Tax=Jannaschia aquimarina TaxID=935700 RepID=A0A0D1ENZ9_9RHOB|nr:flagellar hook-associated protein FlgK [Jannaschia aquimarina]KIT17365.1 Flagellar hook-associated protein 1 [Jannaschia aquimarina]SNS45403.1 flagellar hook-associated protein 1 FlgK [Jannaschia aquimarina]